MHNFTEGAYNNIKCNNKLTKGNLLFWAYTTGSKLIGHLLYSIYDCSYSRLLIWSWLCTYTCTYTFAAIKVNVNEYNIFIQVIMWLYLKHNKSVAGFPGSQTLHHGSILEITQEWHMPIIFYDMFIILQYCSYYGFLKVQKLSCLTSFDDLLRLTLS